MARDFAVICRASVATLGVAVVLAPLAFAGLSVAGDRVVGAFAVGEQDDPFSGGTNRYVAARSEGGETALVFRCFAGRLSIALGVGERGEGEEIAVDYVAGGGPPRTLAGKRADKMIAFDFDRGQAQILADALAAERLAFRYSLGGETVVLAVFPLEGATAAFGDFLKDCPPGA